MNRLNKLTIGEVARQAGVHVETLRYYERRGIIDKPPRSGANYRLYPSETIHRVRFIKRAQELGFSLTETAELFSLRMNPEASRAEVKTRAEEKLTDIEAKIQTLQRMKKALRTITARCDGTGSTTDCPILNALEGIS